MSLGAKIAGLLVLALAASIILRGPRKYDTLELTAGQLGGGWYTMASGMAMNGMRASGRTKVLNVLGINRVVLYGRLAKAGKLLERQVNSSIHQHCIYPLNQDTEVCLSSLDEFGSAMGAAFAVMRSYLQCSPLRI